MALTPKQHRFAQLVASGKTQAAAYRGSYDAENMAAQSIREEASRLMANPDISSMVNELREELDEDVRVTLREHLIELKELRNAAKYKDDLGAAIKAEELRGKASGIYVNKTELTGRGGGAVEHRITREIIDTSGD